MSDSTVLATSSWLRRFVAPNRPAARLVCFPHVGGSAVFFARMAQSLSPRIDTLAVQYPGRMERMSEPFAATLTDLADEVAAALTAPASADDGPLALFGHSMGAVVAFEVARRLQAAGRPCDRLFVSGRAAPTAQHRESLSRLDDRALIEEMQRIGGTDPRLFEDPELAALLLGVIRADYGLLEKYRFEPEPLLDCAVTALNGDADPRVSPAAAAGWAARTRGTFRAITLRGGHFYLAEQTAQVVAVVEAGLIGAGAHVGPLAATTTGGAQPR